MGMKMIPSTILLLFVNLQVTCSEENVSLVGINIDRLAHLFNELKEDYANQAKLIAQIQSENEILTKDSIQMKKTIFELAEEYNAQRKLNRQLAEELNEMKMLIKGKSNSAHSQFSEHKVMDRQMEQYEANLPETKSYPPKRLLLTDYPALPAGGVAFFAYIMKSESSPGQHQTIIFDEVRTNVGGHYSHHTGGFTSPGHGVYVFTWSLYCSSNGYLFTEIVLNSEAVSGLYAGAISLGNILSSTGVAVLELNQGDEVHIRTSPTQPIHGMIYSLQQHRSTFSGWKLF